MKNCYPNPYFDSEADKIYFVRWDSDFTKYGKANLTVGEAKKAGQTLWGFLTNYPYNYVWVEQHTIWKYDCDNPMSESWIKNVGFFLRDTYYFEKEDGKTYLVASSTGEKVLFPIGDEELDKDITFWDLFKFGESDWIIEQEEDYNERLYRRLEHG